METDVIPEEKETIAVRRSERLARKLYAARLFLKVKPTWWNNGPIEIFIAIFIFALNFYLVYPFIGKIAPATSFSGPVIPLLTRLIELIVKNFFYANQVVYIFFFLLFPFSFYLFVKKVSSRKIVAILSVLFASLPVYPFAFSRMELMFVTSDGPHIASISLIPLALLGIILFIREGGIKGLLISSISFSLVLLTSPFGFSILIGLAFITTFSEMLLGGGRLKFFRLSAVLLFAFGLSAFWYNPQFGLDMFLGPLGEDLKLTISKLIPVSFFVIPVLAAFGFLLFDRKPELQPLFLASFYTIAFAIILIVGGGLFPSHPSRYIPEFGISLSFLLSIGTVKLTDYLRFLKKEEGGIMGYRVFANLVLFLIVIINVSMIVLLKNDFSYVDQNVLGIWTGVERGELWLAREKVGQFHSILGYAITCGTVISLPYIWRKSKTG